MGTPVPGQNTSPSERLPAHVTLVRSLARMDTPVFRQDKIRRESLPTDVTLVWFLARVDTVVTGQATEQTEGLAADIAAVRLLPRMHHAMTNQIGHIVGRVRTPPTLVSDVSADVAVTTLYVTVQTILSQTTVVAVRTSNCFSITIWCCLLLCCRAHGLQSLVRISRC